MEYYQAIQIRTGQTVAVINEYVPTLTVGGTTATDLLAQANALTPLAQTRDDALADYDGAHNAENQGFLAIQSLGVTLPKAMEGEMDEEVPAEAALLDLLAPVYALKPRTTVLAVQRGQKLVSALTKTNAYLTAQTPPRPPITSAGKGLAELNALLTAQPALNQTEDDRAAEATTARTDLRAAATAVDRLNKRFYSKLKADARDNPALAAALGQIETEGAHRPATLGIRSILQGGADNLHILISYDNGTYDGSYTSTVEWSIDGEEPAFNHSVPADPSGNTLGPFVVGQTVELRTRVTNAMGTTTGSVRKLKIVGA